VILPVNVRFGDNEDVIKEEFAKVLEVMAFPVIDSHLKILDGLLIFGLTLSFVDLIRDPFGGFTACFEFIKKGIRAILGTDVFDEVLNLAKCHQSFGCLRDGIDRATHAKYKWVFAYTLNRLD
jgi:hypothetical protein